MKEEFRLTVGRGLPLSGLAGLASARPAESKPSNLLSSKAVLGFAAAVAAFGLVVISIKRSLSTLPDSSEKEDSTSPLEPVELPTVKTEALKVDVPEIPPKVLEPDNKVEEPQSLWSRVKSTVKSLVSSSESSKVPPKKELPLAVAEKPKQLENSGVALKRESDILSKGNFSDQEKSLVKRIARDDLTVRATIGRQMPEEVRAEIVAAAKRHGLDPEQMLRVASLESGGNPYAVSATGAVGVFQFTSATASDFGLTNRFDYRANIEAGMLLAKRSRKSLKKAGLGDKADSALALYIAHQIGAQGAKEVLSKTHKTKISALSKSTQKNIRVNIGGKSSTVGEYLNANANALKSTYDQQVASSTPGVSIAESLPQIPLNSKPSSVAAASVQSPASPSQPQTSTKVSMNSEKSPDTSFSPKDDVPVVASAGRTYSLPAQSEPDNLEQSGSSPTNPQSIMKTKQGMMVSYG